MLSCVQDKQLASQQQNRKQKKRKNEIDTMRQKLGRPQVKAFKEVTQQVRQDTCQHICSLSMHITK